MFAAYGVKGGKKLLYHSFGQGSVNRNIIRTLAAVADEDKFLPAKRLLKHNNIYQRRRTTVRERKLIKQYREKIVLYKNEEKYRLALRTFNEMTGNGLVPDVQTYTTMLWICKRMRQPTFALKLFRDMVAQGVTPDNIAFSNAMSALTRGGDWENALHMFDTLSKMKNQAPNVDVYNAAIRACGKGGEWKRALQLFSDMKEKRTDYFIEPNAVSYSEILSTCTRCEQASKAIEIYEDSLKEKISLNIVGYVAVIRAYGKLNNLEMACQTFESMKRNGVKPNAFAFSAILEACESGGKWQQAVKLFEEQFTYNVRPNPYTYSSLICACTNGGEWERSIKYTEEMSNLGLIPSSLLSRAKIALITCYGKVKDVDSALRIFHNLQKKTPEAYEAVIEISKENSCLDNIELYQREMDRIVSTVNVS